MPSSTPLQRQIKLRAASSLGQPRPASASLGQPRPASAIWLVSGLASRLYRPCSPHRHAAPLLRPADRAGGDGGRRHPACRRSVSLVSRLMRSCSASDPVRIAQEERIGIPILGSRGYRIWFRFGTDPKTGTNIYGTTDGGGRLTDSLDKHGFWRDALGCDTRGCACVCVETRKYTFTALYGGGAGGGPLWLCARLRAVASFIRTHAY